MSEPTITPPDAPAPIGPLPAVSPAPTVLDTYDQIRVHNPLAAADYLTAHAGAIDAARNGA